MSGATTRKPSAASASIWCRQENQDSGKPCTSSTSGPSPCSAMLIRIPLLSIIRCVVLTIFPSRSEVAADAVDESASGATRNASGAIAAANSWRLFMRFLPAGHRPGPLRPPIKLVRLGTSKVDIWYLLVPSQAGKCSMSPNIMSREVDAEGEEVRKRILGAALSAFMEGGFAQTSTLEIATRARVSKRELYALFGNKEAMLVACITERARRLKAPADLPELRDRETLSKVLTAFGTNLLTETTDPVVVAVFRLAISESVHAPKV